MNKAALANAFIECLIGKDKKNVGVYYISSRETFYSPELPPALIVVCAEQDSRYISCCKLSTPGKSEVIPEEDRTKWFYVKEAEIQNNNVIRLYKGQPEDEGKVLMIFGKMKKISYGINF